MNAKKVFYKDFVNEMLGNKPCIEIYFRVDNHPEYQSCWLGKRDDEETKSTVYWYGLMEDGSQAYDYTTIEEFINAKVFQDKSIKDIWNLISLYSFNACDVDVFMSVI